MAEFFVDAGLELVAKGRQALGDGVGILTGLDGFDASVFDRLRHVEVGLADREVDRVLHLGRQVEHLADAAGIEGVGAVGEGGHRARVGG